MVSSQCKAIIVITWTSADLSSIRPSTNFSEIQTLNFYFNKINCEMWSANCHPFCLHGLSVLWCNSNITGLSFQDSWILPQTAGGISIEASHPQWTHQQGTPRLSSSQSSHQDFFVWLKRTYIVLPRKLFSKAYKTGILGLTLPPS